MSPLTSGRSYWVSSTPATDYPTLDADITVDVCVVGAGLAGLLCAWRLAGTGRTVALVESRRIAASVSGFTTGKLTSQHGLRYRQIVDSHGDEAAAQYAAANQRGMHRIINLAHDLGIDADIEERDAYVHTSSPLHVDQFRAEAAAASAAGLPATCVTDTELPFDVAAAVRITSQAQMHPRKLLLALTAALAAKGCRIFEQSGVKQIDPAGLRGSCTAHTESGAVHADQVIVATLLPSGGMGQELRQAMYCHQGFVVALPVERDPLPHGMYISYDRPMRSLRTIADGERRLLQVGGSGQVSPGATLETTYGELAKWAAENFEVGEIAYQWTTQDYSTSDGLPLVGRASAEQRGVYVASGFGGWGLTTAAVAAEMLTAQIDAPEHDHPLSRLFDPTRALAPAGAAVVSRHMSGPGQPTLDDARKMPSGEAAIVDAEGQQVAAHRNQDGILHTVSAVCTHLGGIVLWSSVESAWICPCHGSKFAPDGIVLAGPAHDPLPPIDHHS